MDFNWGQGAKGAAGGALAGSALGPWGAAAGGAIGGAIGLFSGNGESPDQARTRQMLMDYYKNVQGRQPVQLGPTQYGQTDNGVRNQQQSLVDQLTAISQGKGPSLAEQQLRSATDRNVAQQASFANSGRGGPMAAARAANNSARLGAQSAQDAASARIAEANAARDQLGLNLHGMRESSDTMSRFNAEQGNQASQAQMWATLKQQGMSDEAAMNVIKGLQGQDSFDVTRPGVGDQTLAGGAGLYSMYTSQNAQGRASGGGGVSSYGMPMTGPVTSPSQTGMFGKYARNDNG